MEKITINSVDDSARTAKDGYMAKITYNVDKKFNTFDEQEGHWFKTKLGQIVEVEFEQKGNFLNLKSFDMDQKTNTVTVETIKVDNIPQEAKGSVLSVRDNIIVSQVILKGAIELAKVELPTGYNNEQLVEFLNMAVVELAGAYKVALDILQ